MTVDNSASSPLEPNALGALIEMVGLDEPDFLIELIDTFLVDSSDIVSGMPESWRNNDRETVLRAAHSLKSTSATFQALRLSKLSSDLESEMRGDETGMDVTSQIDQIVAEHLLVKEALAHERAKLEATL